MSDLLTRLQTALGGAYRLERELGGGGMSRVFVAEDTSLGRRVVLKVLPPELGAGLSIDRFRREIQLAASLHHPNIVPLLTAGEADGLLYYTMPLIDGDSLRTRLAREGELPVAEVVRLIRDVVDALACAHERGVVHRDIKPDNVLLSRNHGLVTDFGVAKALSEATGGSSLTSAGVALGTPAYMAPEQATADPHVDHRADIYAVGALAYEMLAGRPPFAAPTPQAVLAAQVTQTPEPVTRFRPSVPPALAALVMRCLEKRPADRWQSADELLHQLEAMGTPSGGMAPTGSVTPVGQAAAGPAAATREARQWQRAGYLLLGLSVALAGAWGVSRFRGGHAATPEDATGARTVAVLPFENLGRPEDAYFADGITEEITNRLTGIAGLRVIARSSAKQYKGTTKSLRQIGQELGAGYVLEGTVRWEKTGDTASLVRVSPELIRISDGTSVWGRGYDAVLASVFKVQAEIAEAVAGALNVALAAPEREALQVRPTEDQQAYAYYLQGRNYYDRSAGRDGVDLRLSEDLYRKALQLDPKFALAWAALAQTHDGLYWFYYDRTEERLTQEHEAAQRALTLAPSLPEAHIAMGFYHYHGHLDYDAALREFESARAARPSDPDVLASIAFVQRRQGKWEDAYDNLKQAAALNPRSLTALGEAGATALQLKHHDEAESYLARAVALSPDVPEAYGDLASYYLAIGDTARVREQVQLAISRIGEERVVPQLYRAGGFASLMTGAGPSDWAGYHAVPKRAFGADSAYYYLFNADLYRQQGQKIRSRAYADSAATILRPQAKRDPNEFVYHSLLGLAYGIADRADSAVQEGKRATEILPLTKDANGGQTAIFLLALIYTRLGQKDQAVEQLKTLLGLPAMVTPASLRVDPNFASLRGYPAFDRLIANP
jgi:serine/threonine-protein kinase